MVWGRCFLLPFQCTFKVHVTLGWGIVRHLRNMGTKSQHNYYPSTSHNWEPIPSSNLVLINHDRTGKTYSWIIAYYQININCVIHLINTYFPRNKCITIFQNCSWRTKDCRAPQAKFFQPRKVFKCYIQRKWSQQRLSDGLYWSTNGLETTGI